MSDLATLALMVVICCAGWWWIARTECEEEKGGAWTLETTDSIEKKRKTKQ